MYIPTVRYVYRWYIHLLAFAFVIIDMTVIVIMHDKFIIACTLDVYFRIVVVLLLRYIHFDIVITHFKLAGYAFIRLI